MKYIEIFLKTMYQPYSWSNAININMSTLFEVFKSNSELEDIIAQVNTKNINSIIILSLYKTCCRQN